MQSLREKLFQNRLDQQQHAPGAGTPALAGQRRASARLSSGGDSQLTAEEKALRRKAKKVTGQSPDPPQRTQARRNSDMGLPGDDSDLGGAAKGSPAADSNEDGEQEVTSPRKKAKLVCLADSEGGSS